MLETSDAWSMRVSCSSHRPIDQAYCIEDCRISGNNLPSSYLALKIYGILLRKGNGILCEKKNSTDQKETLENSILNI